MTTPLWRSALISLMISLIRMIEPRKRDPTQMMKGDLIGNQITETHRLHLSIKMTKDDANTSQLRPRQSSTLL